MSALKELGNYLLRGYNAESLEEHDPELYCLVVAVLDDTPHRHPLTEQVFCMSTCHLPSHDPDFGSHHRVSTHEYGWVLWPDPEGVKTPAWLAPIILFCETHKISHVNFDMDAPERDFRRYDW